MNTNQSSWLKRHSLVAYFILTYAISWSIWLPIVLTVRGLIKQPVPYALYYFGSFGPAISAIVMTALTEGRAGMRKLLSRVFKWRVGLRYYAFAVLAPLGFFVLAFILNRLITGGGSDLSLLGEADYMPYLTPLGALGLWFLTYGLGEETGWRGFALPHLQRKHSAASATILLALVWACWHLPAFLFRDTYVDLGVLGFPVFAFSLVFATMVFTWLFNSTGGSVWIVILFHALFNWLSVSEAGGQLAAPIMTVPVILWAFFIPRKYGMENCAPIEKQIA